MSTTFNTAMRITAVNLANELIAATDKDEMPVINTKDMLNSAEAIFNFITQDMEQEERDKPVLVDFPGGLN